MNRFTPFVARARRAWAIALLVVAGVLFATGAALASHLFSDVPTSAVYHDAASWLATRAVTLGCATGLFCPDDFVTRAQMALFMNRLGKALSPTYLTVGGGIAPVDPDALPVVCQTADYTPSFPQRVRVDASVTLEPAGNMAVLVAVMRSTNGGTSWLEMPPASGTAAGSSVAGEWFQVGSFGVENIVPGVPNRFGIRVQRWTGTADTTNARCELLVQITNRNPDGVVPDSLTVRQPSRGR